MLTTPRRLWRHAARPASEVRRKWGWLFRGVPLLSHPPNPPPPPRPHLSFLFGVASRAPPPWPSAKGSSTRVGDSGIDSRFTRLSRTSDLDVGFAGASLPGALPYGVGARTGWAGVSTLSLGEIASLIRNLCLSVAALKICNLSQCGST